MVGGVATLIVDALATRRDGEGLLARLADRHSAHASVRHTVHDVGSIYARLREDPEISVEAFVEYEEMIERAQRTIAGVRARLVGQG